MIKLIHMSTAFISINLFLLRGFWLYKESPMINRKWVKVVPHINDTILLITAIALVMSLQQYPFVHHWLSAKVIALLAYIVLGMYALKFAKTNNQKIIFFFLAMVTFIYIVMVALTRNPAWFL